MRSYILAVLLLLGCENPGTEEIKSDKIKVVCTFTILADMVKNIGGADIVDVNSLVGPNSDPHVFAPTPKSAETLAKADLVFVNGLGFEGWIDRLIEASGYKGEIIITTKGLKSVMTVHDEDSNSTITDPHTWLTIGQALTYIKNIRDALSDHKPGLKANFHKNYKAYKGKLQALERDIRAQIASVPDEKRKVITAHDAFSYFGKAYDIQFSAPQGITTESEPSAKEVARLIDLMKKEKINAVFVENITNERLIRQMAKETGVTIQGILYTDALSEKEEPATTYIKLMDHNVKVLVAAMKLNG